jgi:sec-independent protein translocase protein TatA
MLNSLAMLGGQDLLIVLLVVLVLFGGKKIPELMRGVGQGVGELRKGMEEGQRQVQEAIRHDDTPKSVPTQTTSTTNTTTPVP